MTNSQQPFFVQVFLRGGADGLTFLPPYEDPEYIARRSSTRYAPPLPAPLVDDGSSGVRALDLGSIDGNKIGIAPALDPLRTLFNEGKVSFIQGVGSDEDTRSHFVQQDFVEQGEVAMNSSGSGWLARHLSLSTPPAGSSGNLRALSIRGGPPRSLTGWPAPATLDPFGFQFPPEVTDGTLTASTLNVAAEYAAFPNTGTAPTSAEQLLVDAIQSDTDAIGILQSTPPTTPRPLHISVPAYPTTTFGKHMRLAADLAYNSSTSGEIEIVTVDSGDWDTHAGQGVEPGGRMYNNMDQLARSLLSFQRDMEISQRPFCVFVVTEFGRTTDQNSSGGTDHGRGGVAMVLGSADIFGPNGGSLIGPVEFMLPNTGDLDAEIDIRDVQFELLQKVLCNPNPGAVMGVGPNYTHVPRNVLG